MEMTVRMALKEAFRMSQRARPAVWVLFLTNLGLAALAAIPVYRGILRSTGHSLMGERLWAGFQVDWLIDFQFASVGSLDRYAAVIALFGLLSIPINTILSGGVLCCFRESQLPFSLSAFFQNAGRYAGRLIRLMILGLFCYWILFRTLNQGLNKLISDNTHDWQSDRTVFALQAAACLLLFLGLASVNLVIDYARVKLVLEDGTSAAGAFLSSLAFGISRFRRAVTVYAIPSACGVALLGIYWLVVPWSVINTPLVEGTWAPYRGPLTVALLFLGQQLVMYGRYWFRVATWGGEWSYYSGVRQGRHSGREDSLAPGAPAPE
jgi:hypothetical protein